MVVLFALHGYPSSGIGFEYKYTYFELKKWFGLSFLYWYFWGTCFGLTYTIVGHIQIPALVSTTFYGYTHSCFCPIIGTWKWYELIIIFKVFAQNFWLEWGVVYLIHALWEFLKMICTHIQKKLT